MPSVGKFIYQLKNYLFTLYLEGALRVLQLPFTHRLISLRIICV